MTTNNAREQWAISVVSHGHGSSVLGIINDISTQLAGQNFSIILTQNIPEPENILLRLSESVRGHVTLRQNTCPQGFGANHNAALRDTTADFVVIADPDLRLLEPIFPALEKHLDQSHTGIVSPRAITPDGDLEDNGRPLFTPKLFLQRNLLGRKRNTTRNVQRHTKKVDWLAGLFLAMRKPVFDKVHGFDTHYFMYCEDIDLCLRIQDLRLSCEVINEIEIVHPPRRRTFHSLRHLIWHIQSLLRLWRSPAYERFRLQRQRHHGDLQT